MNSRIRPLDTLGALLTLASLAEAVTGLALLVVPGEVCRLIFGTASDGSGQAMSRVTGIALAALAVSCWPAGSPRWPLRGMLAYSLLVALYLAALGLTAEATGLLLWPAVVVHAAMTVLLAAMGRRYLGQVSQ